VPASSSSRPARSSRLSAARARPPSSSHHTSATTEATVASNASAYGRALDASNAIPGHATNGAIGFDDLKWLKPVRPGDVLSVENVVVEKIESRSRRDIGVVKIAGRVLSQTGEAVMSLTSLVLYRRRPGV